MPLELWNTVATVGTFLVITATAITALIQIRHARGNNQISALSEFQNIANTPGFVKAQHYVLTALHTRLQDPAFRYECTHRKARSLESQEAVTWMAAVGNFYENMGVLVKTGLLDKDVTIDIWGANAAAAWAQMTTIVTLFRRADPTIYENFEYLIVCAEEWSAVHRDGGYPKNVRRIALEDPFRAEDERYAAQREEA